MTGNTLAENPHTGGGWRGSRWRTAAWTAAAALWLLPLVAMQFTDEVRWGILDFAVFGVLLAGVGVTYELAARMTRDTAYRAAAGVALAAAFLLVWLSLGVGIIGRDGDLANVMYFGVLAIGIVGALVARFRPDGMARALITMALAQTLVTTTAIVSELGYPWSGPLKLLLLNGFFVALWLASAWLFQRAAHGRSQRSTV